MYDDRVVGHEGPHTDRIVDGHQRLDAGTELAVVFLAQVLSTEIRALIDQVLDDGNFSHVRLHHQRRNPVVIGRIHVFSELHKQFDTSSLSAADFPRLWPLMNLVPAAAMSVVLAPFGFVSGNRILSKPAPPPLTNLQLNSGRLRVAGSSLHWGRQQRALPAGRFHDLGQGRSLGPPHHLLHLRALALGARLGFPRCWLGVALRSSSFRSREKLARSNGSSLSS